MRAFSVRDVIGGLVVVGVGAFFFIGSFDYPMGTLRRMGAGYFPMLLGAITMGVGALIVLLGRDPAPSFGSTLRPLVAVTVAIASFALIIRPFGLLPAAFVAAFVAGLGDRTAPIATIIFAGAVIAIAAWALFILGLGLPIRAIRWPS